MDEKRLALQAGADGVSPEQVLVFETNGPVTDFLDALAAAPGLEWLAEEVLRDIDPDEDFFIGAQGGRRTDKKLKACVYLVLTNQGALAQFLSLWAAWKANKRRAPGLSQWGKVFAKLRDIRRWGVEDRLAETGILDQWREEAAWGGDTAVEIELWFQDEQKRAQAAKDVSLHVTNAQGQILQTAILPEIRYHALLAKLPRTAVETIIETRGVSLVQADEVRFFRPIPQTVRKRDPQPGSDPRLPPTIDIALGEPTVALLDGLPVENHVHLAGRLKVDDPDGYAETYPAAARRHGTAMASLIQRGDLLAGEPPSRRRLYVRPIMKPHPLLRNREQVPTDRLWVDLVNIAVNRMYVGDSTAAPVAPRAKIINFSLGDTYQPFLHSVSPIARLLDWLSWTHQALFIVSAGNHQPVEVRFPAGTVANEEETAVLQYLFNNSRHRRLLAPGEAVNAVSVGALHEDNVADWASPSGNQSVLLRSSGLPSPISAVGRGLRRAVKPDILAPGGRHVFDRQPQDAGGEAIFVSADGPKLPGQSVAAPGKREGDLSATAYECGSSNAAALTTRLAEQINDGIASLLETEPPSVLHDLPPAVVTKTLLAHTGSWRPGAYEALAKALRNRQNASTFKDLVSAFLGYGCIRPDRGTGCTDQRVTFLSGGFAQPDDFWLHRIPIPACLHAQEGWRRLTITLAWLTPINPRSPKYRCVQLSFAVTQALASPLGVDRAQVHGNAVTRGTIQHEVLESHSGAMDVGADAEIEIQVSCGEDAPLTTALPERGVPYALAVSLEVAPETGLPIYEQVRDRIRPAVKVGV